MKNILFLFLTLFLVACSGGGGSSNPPNQPNNPNQEDTPKTIYSELDLFMTSCKDPSDPNWKKQEDCLCLTSQKTNDKRDCHQINSDIKTFSYQTLPQVDCTQVGTGADEFHKTSVVQSCAVEEEIPLVRDMNTYQILNSIKLWSGLSLTSCQNDPLIMGRVLRADADFSAKNNTSWDTASNGTTVTISGISYLKEAGSSLQTICSPYGSSYKRVGELTCQSGFSQKYIQVGGYYKCESNPLTYTVNYSPASTPVCSGIVSATTSIASCSSGTNSDCVPFLKPENFIKSPQGNISLVNHPFSNLKNYSSVSFSCNEGEKVDLSNIDWENLFSSNNPYAVSLYSKYSIVCNSGFHQEGTSFLTANCVPNSRSCVASGQRNGSQSWVGSSWGVCIANPGIDVCNSGSSLVNGQCVVNPVVVPPLPSGSTALTTNLKVQPFQYIKFIYSPDDSSYQTKYYIDTPATQESEVALINNPILNSSIKLKKVLSDSTDDKAYFLDHSNNLYRVSNVHNSLKNSLTPAPLVLGVKEFTMSSDFYCYSSTDNDWTCKSHDDSNSQNFIYSKIYGVNGNKNLCGLTTDNKAKCWSSLNSSQPEQWNTLVDSSPRPLFRHDRTVSYYGEYPQHHNPDPDVKNIYIFNNGNICAVLANNDLRCASDSTNSISSLDGKVILSNIDESSISFDTKAFCVTKSDGVYCHGEVGGITTSIGSNDVISSFKKIILDSSKNYRIENNLLVSNSMEYYTFSGKKLEGIDYTLYGSIGNVLLNQQNKLSWNYSALSNYQDILTIQENPNIGSMQNGPAILFLNSPLGDYCGIKKKSDGEYLFCSYLQKIFEKKL